MNIKNILFTVCVFFTTTFSLFCNKTFSDADAPKARIYLKKFLEDSYNIAKQDLKHEAEKQKFAQIIVKNFSLSTMSPYILGRYRTKLSAAQSASFEKMLTDYFLKTYGTSEKIDLFASTDMRGDNLKEEFTFNNKKNRITFSGNFKTANGSVFAKFVLIKEGENRFKIFDIYIENIGLLFGTRDQIATLHKNQTETPENFLKNFQAIIQ